MAPERIVSIQPMLCCTLQMHTVYSGAVMSCRACGALDRYIIQGVCRACGHAVELQPTEWRSAL